MSGTDEKKIALEALHGGDSRERHHAWVHERRPGLGARIFVERDQTLTLRFRDDGSAFDLLEFRKMIEEWRGHHRTAHHRAPALA